MRVVDVKKKASLIVTGSVLKYKNSNPNANRIRNNVEISIY
jgi:hypothetical protein